MQHKRTERRRVMGTGQSLRISCQSWNMFQLPSGSTKVERSWEGIDWTWLDRLRSPTTKALRRKLLQHLLHFLLDLTATGPAVNQLSLGDQRIKSLAPKLPSAMDCKREKTIYIYIYREQMIIPGIKSLKLVKAGTSLSFLIYRTLDMFFMGKFQE